MPQWRKLHTKTVDSIDVAEMPDDFTRLTWVMLPLALDRCGRGIDNAHWVRSKVHPMRDDVKVQDVEAALDWYAERGMIERYAVDGRHYFWIPTWHKYQGKTEREADSVIPAPLGYIDPKNDEAENDDEQEQVDTESGASQEQVVSKSGLDIDVDSDVDVDIEPSAIAGADAPPTPSTDKPDDPPKPQNLDGWLALIESSKNRQAVLRQMVMALYPAHDPPDFAYIGKVAKAVGGASRLAQLLWMSVAYRVTGDVLAYCKAMSKGGKGNGRDNTAAGNREAGGRDHNTPTPEQIAADRAALEENRRRRAASAV